MKRTKHDPDPPDGPRAQPSVPAREREPTLAPAMLGGALLGGVFILLGIAGLILNHELPWLRLDPFAQPGMPEGVPVPPPEDFDRSQTEQLATASNYLQRLVDWPIPLLATGIVAGAALALVPFVPRIDPRTRRFLQAVPALAAAYAGFVLALTGARWFGIQVEQLMAPGDPVLVVLGAPYVNLATGLAMAGGAGALLARDLEWLRRNTTPAAASNIPDQRPILMVLLAAIALFALPLIPYTAYASPYGDYHVGESTYAQQAEDGPESSAGKAGLAIGLARLMLWITLYVSLASVVFTWVGRADIPGGPTWAILSRAAALNAIPIVVGGTFTGLVYLRLADTEGATITFNHVLPLAWVGLAVLVVLHAVRDVLPWLRVHTTAPEGESSEGVHES